MPLNHSDPDGIIVKYEWKADGKPIGTTPKVAHVFEKPGNHQIEVTITDDSPTRTKSVTQVFNVFANAAPKPEIVLPSPIYENERIALVPKPLQDADGDTLRFSWLIDGKPYKDEFVQFPAGRHLIQLNADDQRNLAQLTRFALEGSASSSAAAFSDFASQAYRSRHDN
jgi:hypothetical protein